MKHTTITITIPVVEMTREEETLIFRDYANREKYGIKHWNTSDGNNEILFEGEETYCVIVRKGD
jgi:hypothetical protein